MRYFLFALLVTSLLAGAAEAQNFVPKTSGVTLKTVVVPASNAAVQACASIIDGCTMVIPPDAAVGVRFFPLNAGSLCSGVAVKRGSYMAPGGGYTCAPHEPGGICYSWVGQVCMILESGAVAVSVEVIER